MVLAISKNQSSRVKKSFFVLFLLKSALLGFLLFIMGRILEDKTWILYVADSLFFISLCLSDSLYAAIAYMLIMLKFKCLAQISLIATKCLLDFSTWPFQR